MGLGLVIILGVAVLATAIVISLVAALVRYRDRVRHPCCGACRYPVEGLTSFTCPECGADLRSAGILVPGVRPKHRIHFAEIIAAWATICLFGGVFGVGFSANTSWGGEISFTRNETLTPASASLSPLTAVWSGRTSSATSITLAPADHLALSSLSPVSPGGAIARLDVNYIDQTWRIAPAGSLAGTKIPGTLPLSEGDLAAWLAASGNPVTAAAPGEVAAIAAYINSAGTTPTPTAFQSATGMTSSTLTPKSWVIVTSAVAWPAIFALGCLFIVKAHARKRPAVTAAASRDSLPAPAAR
jgi:hypothetical protein